MRILIDDKPVDALTPKRERSLMLGRTQDDVKGAVLTPAEATESYVRQTKRWFTILAVIALVLMAAISIAGISYEPRDGAFVAVGVVVIGGGLLLFMRLLLGRRVEPGIASSRTASKASRRRARRSSSTPGAYRSGPRSSTGRHSSSNRSSSPAARCPKATPRPTSCWSSGCR